MVGDPDRDFLAMMIPHRGEPSTWLKQAIKTPYMQEVGTHLDETAKLPPVSPTPAVGMTASPHNRAYTADQVSNWK